MDNGRQDNMPGRRYTPEEIIGKLGRLKSS
jgi:hypothetical protein